MNMDFEITCQNSFESQRRWCNAALMLVTITGAHFASAGPAPNHSCKDSRTVKDHSIIDTTRHMPTIERADDHQRLAGSIHCGLRVRSLIVESSAHRVSRISTRALIRILGQRSALRRNLVSSSRFDPHALADIIQSTRKCGRENYSREDGKQPLDRFGTKVCRDP